MAGMAIEEPGEPGTEDGLAITAVGAEADIGECAEASIASFTRLPERFETD
jgi:hypothetical protein